jgi:L-amino acid N-acyltransferase YncA
MLRFEVRPARKVDYAGIVRILNAYADQPLTIGAFIRWESERVAVGGFQRLVAVSPDGTLLATGVARTGLGCDIENALVQVMVAPAHAHEEIAPMLQAVLERWAVEQGAVRIVSVVKSGSAVTRSKRVWMAAMPVTSLLPQWNPPAIDSQPRIAAAR